MTPRVRASAGDELLIEPWETGGRRRGSDPLPTPEDPVEDDADQSLQREGEEAAQQPVHSR